MSQFVRRWLLPLVVAGAVLGVIALVWLQRPGAPGGDLGVAAGGGVAGGAATSDGVAGGGDSGSRGAGSAPYDEPTAGTEPGSPGLEPPNPLADPPETPTPDVAVPRHLIGVDSYYRYDARRLALNFSNGVPECYGTAGGPQVEETEDAVVVTIPRISPPGNDDVACIEIAVLLSVPIFLDEPLGDRAVLDGSRDRAPVPEADTAYENEPTY